MLGGYIIVTIMREIFEGRAANWELTHAPVFYTFANAKLVGVWFFSNETRYYINENLF